VLFRSRKTEREARRLVKRWGRLINARWKLGKAACSVADHVVRYEEQGVLATRKAPHRVGRGVTRVGRDWANPEEGEVFSTKRGDLWRVKGVNPKGRVIVERAGNLRVGGSELIWSRDSLRQMKDVSSKFRSKLPSALEEDWAAKSAKRGAEAQKKTVEAEWAERSAKRAAESSAEGPKKSFWSSLVSGDPSRARRSVKATTFVQSLMYYKDRWTLRQATAWARKHGFRTMKVDVTKNMYRFRQVDPSTVKVLATKVLGRKSLGVSAIIAVEKRVRRTS